MVGQVEKEKQNDGTRKWKFQSLKTTGKFLTITIIHIKAKFIKEKNWADVGNSLSSPLQNNPAYCSSFLNAIIHF